MGLGHVGWAMWAVQAPSSPADWGTTLMLAPPLEGLGLPLSSHMRARPQPLSGKVRGAEVSGRYQATLGWRGAWCITAQGLHPRQATRQDSRPSATGHNQPLVTMREGTQPCSPCSCRHSTLAKPAEAGGTGACWQGPLGGLGSEQTPEPTATYMSSQKEA